MRNELALLVPGQPGGDLRASLRPLNGQGTPDFLGHIVGLIVGEVILTPQLFGGGDDGYEAG
jgi:hypothetical protein